MKRGRETESARDRAVPEFPDESHPIGDEREESRPVQNEQLHAWQGRGQPEQPV